MTATARFADDVQETILSQMWWAVLLKAAAVIAFGVVAFYWLGKTPAGLAMVFGGYALVDGVLSLIGAARGGGVPARWGLAMAGGVSLIAGAAALWPAVPAPPIDTIIGVWAIARGGLEFASALKLRQHMERDWTLALIGMLSMMFGAMLILYPNFEHWTFVRLLGLYCLVVGALMAVLAVRFRRGLRP